MARKLAIMIVSVIFLQLFSSPFQAEAADFSNKVNEQRKEISPQVIHIQQSFTSGNINEFVNVLDVNLNNPYTKLELGIPNPLNSLKTVSSYTKENSVAGHRVVGAINASFFLGNGQPANLLAQNNEIINYGILGENTESPTQNPVAFGISKTGQAIADYYSANLTFTINGKKYKIDRINNTRDANKTVLYTPAKYSTGTNEWGMEIVVTGASQRMDKIHFGDSFTGVVSSMTSMGNGGNAVIPKDGFVLSVQNGDIAKEISSMIEAGSIVEVSIGIDQKWMDAEYILAAGPLLVKNGQPNISMPTNSNFVKGRNPRTAIAVDSTGKRVFLVTVDGRVKGHSNGTSLTELANYLISLGASSAINLDGGGSTTMVARAPGGHYPTLVNRPSEGSERRVSAILQVVNNAPQGSVNFIKLGNIPGEIVKDSSIQMTVSYAWDEYLNPMYVNPASMNWSVEGNIGKMNGTTFTATAKGQGKIIGEYKGVRASIPVKVVDLADKPVYKDVQSNHWAFDSIQALYERQLIKGYIDGTFKPANSITRGEAAVIISRALNLAPTGGNGFSDVKSNYYAHNAIVAVAEHGIITGRQAGKFDPEGKLTRAEMATILARAYKLEGESVLSFPDVSSKHWANKSIQALVANNLTKGTNEGTFKPDARISRAEFATFLDRVMN